MARRSRGRQRARTRSAGLLRAIPQPRVLLGCVGVVALAGALYAAALETSVFAVRKLEIVGGNAQEQSELRAALAPELGRSLLRVGAGEIDRQVAKLSDLVKVSFDREFPSTLKLRITPERPVMLLRRQNDTWLVSARGRVMRELKSPRLSSLPRTYVKQGTQISVGETLPARDGGLAAAALAPLSRGTFPSAVRFVRETPSELTLVLASRLQIRLGSVGDLQLKLAIARRILKRVGATSATTGYLDVSVPERPVIASS